MASSAAEDGPAASRSEPACEPEREPVREAVRDPLREPGGEDSERATAVLRLLLGAGGRGKDGVSGDAGFDVGGDVGRDVGCRRAWDDRSAVDVDLREEDDGMDARAALSAGEAMANIGVGVVGRVGGGMGTARAASLVGAMSSRAKALHASRTVGEACQSPKVKERLIKGRPQDIRSE
jgi:hypothetical protein